MKGKIWGLEKFGDCEGNERTAVIVSMQSTNGSEVR